MYACRCLDFFIFASTAWWLTLRRSHLLACHGQPFAPSTGSGVSLGSLPTRRQTTAMTLPAIAINLNQSFDIETFHSAQVAFHRKSGLLNFFPQAARFHLPSNPGRAARQGCQAFDTLWLPSFYQCREYKSAQLTCACFAADPHQLFGPLVIQLLFHVSSTCRQQINAFCTPY